MGGYRDNRTRVVFRVHSDRARGNRYKLQHGTFQVHGFLVFCHCESGQISKQAPRDGCVISILGEIQRFTRQSAEQPDLSGPVLSRRLD